MSEREHLNDTKTPLMIMLKVFLFEYLLRSSQPSTLVQSRQARRDDDEDEEEIDDDDDDDIVPGTLVLSKQARREGKVHLDGDSTYDHR